MKLDQRPRSLFDCLGNYFLDESVGRWIGVMLVCVGLFGTPAVYAAEPVCAAVKIEIQQELTIERQAFDAMMRINNNLEGISITDFYISVNFKDEAGATKIASSDPLHQTAEFFIKIDRYSGIDGGAVDGADITAGTVLPATTAEIHWLIIPATGTGGVAPSGTLYFVGASIDYAVGGVAEHVEVAPDFITVKPLPKLTLDYFMTREIIADDPFTPYVEPSVPFTLGVRIQNNGAATAEAVGIDTAQPEIVENEQDLAISFSILGSSVNGQTATPSLFMEFGDIEPNNAKVGRWSMITSILGRFVDFNANFTHDDGLGGELTSLLEAANAHSLLRNVKVDLPGRDQIRDFLARDGVGETAVLRVYESDNVDTLVTNHIGSTILSASSPGIDLNDVVHTLTLPATSGLAYGQLGDIYSGSRYVKNAVRSDGKQISSDNIWFSKTRNVSSWIYYLNIFDTNTSGSYTLVLGLNAGGLFPVFDVIADQLVFENELLTFTVTATDPEGTIPGLSASGLPAGASFVDNSNGTGTFTWTPATSDAGIYLPIFIANDGALITNTSAVVRVISETSDIDNDGMADGWEFAQFGSLERDGTGDFDGDGISDLLEFQNGTNPNAATPVAPTGIAATASEGSISIAWLPVTGATSYNLYWSTTPGVTKSGGTQVLNVTSPYVHSGLNAGAAYYYAVTAVTVSDESQTSTEASATTSIERAWKLPSVISSSATDLNADFESQIAVADNGDAVAVWTQCILTDCLWASRYNQATGWTVPEAVASGSVAGPRVVMDADANITVVWMAKDETGASKQIWARRFVTGAWEAAAMIQDAAALNGHLDYPSGIDVLVLPVGSLVMPEGGMIATWTLWEEWDNERVYSGNYRNGAGWETPRVLKEGHSPRQVVNFSGNPTLLMNFLNPGSLTHYLLYRQWLPGLESSGRDYYYYGGGVDAINYSDIYSPSDVVLSSNNEGMAVWKELKVSTTDTFSYWARTYDGSTWTTNIQSLGQDTGLDGHLAGLDTDGAGNYVVAVTDPTASGGGTLRYYSQGLSTWNNWEQYPKLTSLKVTGRTTNTIMDTSGHASVLQISAGNGLWASRFNLKVDGLRDLQEQYVSNYIDGDNGISGMTMARDANDVIITLGRREDGQVQVSRYQSFITPPKSIINGPASVDEGAVIVLDGTSSTDAGGDIVSYEWKQVRGAVATLGVTNTSSLNVTAPVVHTDEDQKLIFALILVDGDGAIVTGLHEVTVNAIKAGGLSPVISAVSNQVVYQSQLLSFVVNASDPEAVIPTLTTDPLPTGATFTDQANGSGSFSWTPTSGQVGAYTIQVTASDGNLNTTVPVSVSVINTTSDVDADGMIDDWEMTNFAYLDNDGTGNADRDAFTDLQEFTGETDPNANTAGPPQGIVVKTAEYMAQLSWQVHPYVDSYNLYWSTTPGVTKATGNLIAGVSSAYRHENLDPGTTYYYALSAVIPNSESILSTEAIAIMSAPRAWSLPTQLTSTATNLSDEFISQIDVASNGNAIAVWTQCIATDCLWVSHYTPGGGWTTPLAIASGNVSSPRVNLGEDGNAVVVWLIEDGANSKKEIWGRTYLSGVWQTAQLIQDATLFVSGHYDTNPGPDVILKLDGTAVVAWNLWESPDTYKIYITHHHVGSGWEAPRYQRTGYMPRQAIDALGKAVLSYYADYTTSPLTYMIHSDFWSDNASQDYYLNNGTGAWTNVRFMDFNDPHEFMMHGDKKGMLIWKDYSNTNNDGLHYIGRSLDGYWQNAYYNEPNTGLGTNMGGLAGLEIDSNWLSNYVMPVVDPFDVAGGSLRYKVPGGYWTSYSGLSTLSVSDYSTTTVMDSAGNGMVAQITEGPGLWSTRYPLRPDLSRGKIEQYVGNFIDGNNGVLGLSMDIDSNEVVQLIGRREDGHVYVSQYKSFTSVPQVVISGLASANEGTAVTLDGTGTVDVGSVISSYEWKQVRGPAVTLTGASTTTLSFNMPVYDVNNDSLVFVLVTVNVDGAIGSAMHDITNVDVP